jgi:hypothetical protein
MFNDLTTRAHIVSNKVLIISCQGFDDFMDSISKEAYPLAKAIQDQGLDIHSIRFQCPEVAPWAIPLEKIFHYLGEQTKKQTKKRNRKSWGVYRLRQNRTITEIP